MQLILYPVKSTSSLELTNRSLLQFSRWMIQFVITDWEYDRLLKAQIIIPNHLFGKYN